MHVLFRDSRGLEEVETPTDPGQSPADLLVLSYSDSDLGAFAAGWQRGRDGLPGLRLCNLTALRHPVSVDQYAEATLAGARAILVRLIGGEAYWPYGVATLQDLARRRGIALALLPADGRPDPVLDRLSTLPVPVLRRLTALCDQGGAVAAQMALAELAQAAGLPAAPVPGQPAIPDFGFYDPDRGVIDAPEPGLLVSFYRSYLTSADLAPVDALIHALRAAGLPATGVFAPSLKAPGLAGWLAPHLAQTRAVVNLTAFSARDDAGLTPFGAECPVFQVALSTAPRDLWAAEERGLSAADLAMHVVLPEVDGRIFLGAISFKAAQARDPDLQWARMVHAPDAALIAAVVGRIGARLALPGAARALVLSTYPGKPHQIAHAVGLDALASVGAMLGMDHAALGQRLLAARIDWDGYPRALARLPAGQRADLLAAWGPAPARLSFAALRHGADLIALQPERGNVASRGDDYHDLSRTPRHEYVAFYLWLRDQVDALVHIGAHGTLEWLPGKSVALSGGCWPQALLGDLPVIYPFIVNDPGEAAQAKRRLSAVTLGHLPPPLVDAALPEALTHLERLLDEYSTADGLDPRRRDRLVGAIRDEARAAGVETDLGLPPDAAPAEAIPLIDRFLCDLKDSRFGDGLHVYGSAPGEAQGLTRALTGLHVAPGPSGSPARGRLDVLPTGRNLFTVDPRAVPSRNAHAQGVKLAGELLRRHLQDHGDWPRGLVVDLWGSATMRTAGEDFAMALHLAGLCPRWDAASGRVSGVEIIPLPELGRPRIDLTLRVSGLFRDTFPGLAQLFETGAQALATRDEAPEDNPYRARAPRVFGPKPGLYGLAITDLAETFTDEARAAAGEAWLAASSHAIAADGAITHQPQAIRDRLAGADAFVHAQDLPESDLLLASDYAAHEAGFAAAMARIGARAPALYHLDATIPDRPRARALTEEIARVTRARAADPKWADSMMRHGFRGAAEIAATLDHMAAFANLAGVVPGHLFDLYHQATLERADLVAFMERENPAALAAMRAMFARLLDSGLWVTRRNAVLGGAMSFQVKGWCPGAWRPMQSGDGLVLRIRARNGRLLPDQSRAIADLSARLGNGLIDLTNRANLQLRGLDHTGHEQALETLAALDLLDPTPEAESRRNIILSPFAALAGPEWQAARSLAAALTATDAPQLPAKFGFAIDTDPPVLHDSPADIRLLRHGAGWLVQPQGGTWALTTHDPAQAALTLANWFLKGGPSNGRGRMRDHLRRNPDPPGGAQPLASLFPKYPCDSANPHPAPPPVPGPVPGGRLLGFPFGQITATQLAGLDTALRLTPWRMLLLETPTPSRIPGAIEAPGDPLLRSHACTGAPGCPQALAETRALARALAPLTDATLHVSGCAKGCAHRGAAGITLIATGPDRFDLVANGGTADPPLHRNLSRIDAARIVAQGKAHDAPL